MAMWPNKGEPDTRPSQEEGYRRVEPVFPRSPAVPEGAFAELRYTTSLPLSVVGSTDASKDAEDTGKTATDPSRQEGS